MFLRNESTKIEPEFISLMPKAFNIRHEASFNLERALCLNGHDTTKKAVASDGLFLSYYLVFLPASIFGKEIDVTDILVDGHGS